MKLNLRREVMGLALFVVAWAASSSAGVPVAVAPVSAKSGMVVAGHPEAAAAGLAVLQAGGNAIDAAVATSLALGVAEPYGSGLGGKIMLLYYEAKSGRTFAVDALDACGSALSVAAIQQLPEEGRSFGYTSVCVPGLAAGLWLAHQRWGARAWAEDVKPAITLARRGAEILPKTRDSYREKEKVLRGGDVDMARIFLPDGQLPVVGMRVKNEDLAKTMELLAEGGREAFYRGPVAKAIVAASKAGGGLLTADDLARYEARIVEPVAVDFSGYRLVSAPPPTVGSARFLPVLKVLEQETLAPGGLRTAANLDLVGRIWREVDLQVYRTIADTPDARFIFERLIAPDSIARIREQVRLGVPAQKAAAFFEIEPFYESAMAATTHFAIVDAQGNIVCATQSLSLHFGAGVVPPGTGIVLNDSMSNFAFADTKSPNFVQPGRRPRTTISPTIVFRNGRPILAIGIPGAARIPTAMLQALIDRLMFNRPLAEAIGDTRVHFAAPLKRGEPTAFEAERSLPAETVEQLRALGWKVELPEAAGTGRHFGGINAIEIGPDGLLTGYADPRRTNAAMGY